MARAEREFIKRQLIEADRLSSVQPAGSFMARAWDARRESLEESLKDWVTANEVSDTLVTLSKAIEAAGESDEEFANAVDDLSPRVLPRLKEFFEIAHKYKTSLRVESGDLRCELSAERIQRAFERTSATFSDTSEIELTGTFRGATLDSWKFDFKPVGEDGQISGRISSDVSEEAAVAMNQKTNQRMVAKLSKTVIHTPSGAIRTKYELQ